MSFGKNVLLFFTFGVGMVGGQILIRKLFGTGSRRQEPNQYNNSNIQNQNQNLKMQSNQTSQSNGNCFNKF